MMEAAAAEAARWADEFMRLITLTVMAVLGLCAGQSARAQSLEQLGSVAQQASGAQKAGNYTAAERLDRQVLEGVSRLPGFPPSERARQMANLASVLNFQGNAPEVLRLLGSAEELLKSSSTADPAQLVTLQFNFARSHALQVEWKLAEERYQAGFKILERESALDSVHANEGLAGFQAQVSANVGRTRACDGVKVRR
jgi:hypothetical protein